MTSIPQLAHMPAYISAYEQAPANLPHFSWGGTGPPMHFLHANGYPPGCYKRLLDTLAGDFRVFGMLLRPLWPKAVPPEIHDWHPFSRDLRHFLENMQAGRVIGMGHSIGAIVTLRTAMYAPGLFRALILLDPVLLPRHRMLQLQVVRTLHVAHRLSHIAAQALARRRHFDDLEQLFAGYRRRGVFRYFSDEQLRTLIEGITRPSPSGGYELAYSPEWEARIYQTGIWNDWDIWAGLSRLNLPVLIIRGAESDTFREGTARMVVRRNPGIKVVSVPAATHLVPLERPEEVFEATREFLRGAL